MFAVSSISPTTTAYRILSAKPGDVSLTDLCAAALEANRCLAADAEDEDVGFDVWAARRVALEAMTDAISGEVAVDRDTGELVAAKPAPDMDAALSALARFWSI